MDVASGSFWFMGAQPEENLTVPVSFLAEFSAFFPCSKAETLAKAFAVCCRDD